MLQVLKFLLVAVEVLFIFNLIIVVHELGHFLAARWRGLVIEEFGVWFGKPIWRRKFNGVWYSWGSIPFGGFVKLPQLGNRAVEGAAETADLPKLNPVDKIIVAFAGPLFSMLLAFVLASVITVVGRPTTPSDTSTEIGSVLAGGPADKAGLKPGDRILAIDGKPVKRFMGPVDSVVWAIVSSEGETIDFLIERQGQQQHIASGWEKEATSRWLRNPLRHVQIGPRTVPEVGKVDEGSPAAKAGLQMGDLVTVANGHPIMTLEEIFAILRQAPTAPLQFTVQRHGAPVETTLTPAPPKKGEEKYGPDLGVDWGRIYLEHPTPWQQVNEAAHSVGNVARAWISSKSDVKTQHLSGPIGIMNLYRRILSSDEGWRMAIVFSVLFNVNLALLNMLPLPVLDGGHITLGFLELIRRRPVNGRFLEVLETACTVVILGFILYVTFFDVGDMINSRKESAPAAATPTPAPAAP